MDAAVSAKSEGERFKPVTMGHIRGHSVTRLFVYCGSTRCNHSATIDVDAASDGVVPRRPWPSDASRGLRACRR
jgi:hypothetical protein